MNKVDTNASSSRVLVGFAIDVSGSMENSIRNYTDEQLTRFESFRQALNHLSKESYNKILECRKKDNEVSIDLFVYGFGFNPDFFDSGVGDFLTLMEMGKSLALSDKQDVFDWKEYKELKDVAEQYGKGDLAKTELFIEYVKNNREKAGNLAEELKHNPIKAMGMASALKIGSFFRGGNSNEKVKFRLDDTTLPIEKVGEFLGNCCKSLDNAKEFIYGNTPMREALIEVKERFKRELAIRPQNTIPLLFLLSDGVPTDGDPLSVAQELRSLNIVIVSCFVTDNDIANPRILLGSPESEWSDGAKLMFNMASTIEEDSKFARFLLKKGWKINPHGRLFVQVNHSEILQEFIQVILSPLEDLEKRDLPQRGV